MGSSEASPRGLPGLCPFTDYGTPQLGTRSPLRERLSGDNTTTGKTKAGWCRRLTRVALDILSWIRLD